MQARVAELALEHRISDATLYGWKTKYGRIEAGEAQRLTVLEDENSGLKHLVADDSLDKEAKPSYEKTGVACRLRSGCGIGDVPIWHERTLGLQARGATPQAVIVTSRNRPQRAIARLGRLV
jgi:hypothetical protein